MLGLIYCPRNIKKISDRVRREYAALGALVITLITTSLKFRKRKRLNLN